MPDRCWSVLSAERSAASIARALPSRRISIVPASTRSPSRDQLLDLHVAVERAEEGGGDVQPGDDDRLAAFISAVKRASAAIVAADVTSPPAAEILGEHAA